MTLQDVGILIALVLTLLGWAYQLGRSDARLGRNEKDITELQAYREQNAKELRENMSQSFEKVYNKLDALPCHNPGWKKEGC